MTRDLSLGDHAQPPFDRPAFRQAASKLSIHSRSLSARVTYKTSSP
jgi:hypothetical protein